MPFPVLLAHGALGPFDEVIFLSVAFIFFAMMGISWFKSRNMPPEFKEPAPPAPNEPEPESPERFKLD
jgi:hypothetical protein